MKAFIIENSQLSLLQLRKDVEKKTQTTNTEKFLHTRTSFITIKFYLKKKILNRYCIRMESIWVALPKYFYPLVNCFHIIMDHNPRMLTDFQHQLCVLFYQKYLFLLVKWVNIFAKSSLSWIGLDLAATMDSNNSEKTEIIMTQNIFSNEEMVQASGVVKWWICVLTLHQSFSSSTFHRWTDHLSFLKRKIWHHPVEKFQVTCEKIHKTHKNKTLFVFQSN